MATELPKRKDANLTHIRMERPEPKKPPRYMYSRRLATSAAIEKQVNDTAVPTKAVTRILQFDHNENESICATVSDIP